MYHVCLCRCKCIHKIYVFYVMHIYMFVYMYVYAYMCVYVCMYEYLYIYYALIFPYSHFIIEIFHYLLYVVYNFIGLIP